MYDGHIVYQSYGGIDPPTGGHSIVGGLNFCQDRTGIVLLTIQIIGAEVSD